MNLLIRNCSCLFFMKTWHVSQTYQVRMAMMPAELWENATRLDRLGDALHG
jgi:hypothetical protein